MRTNIFILFTLVITALVTACPAKVTCEGGECKPPDTCEPACVLPQVCKSGVCANPDQVVPIKLTITPTTARLISVNGSTPTIKFKLTLHYSDGTSSVVALPSLKVEPVELGTFTAEGEFRVNGRFAGTGRITGTLEQLRAFADIVINIEQHTVLPGTPTTAPALFEGTMLTDRTREAEIVYPLDRAVMPQNVPPAEIQWLRSEAGDIFRVTLKKPHVRALYFEATAVPGFSNSLMVDLEGWRRVAQSETNEWALITVDRWIAATREVIRGTPVQVRFPRAALLGSVYYWDIQRGRIVRINDGTTTRDEFMPTPPQNCVGCHAVTNDGRYMAGRFGGGENVGGVFDLTKNLSTDPPPMLFPVTSTTARWWFSSFSPDNQRLIVSVDELGGGRALALLNVFTGAFVTPTVGTLPTGLVTHPAWSPDGRSIAYIGDADQWGGTNTTGNVYTMPVLGPDQFGAPKKVVSGTVTPGLPAGAAASYPTWSPDSKGIAFAHGNSSRSESGQSALYFVAADGTHLVRLDNASGGVDGIMSFQPRFSPFSQDGYYWMSFLSRRDYGNSLAGTQGTGRQQIWVSAIKVNAKPGDDPSEVPYWLPGQNTDSLNIAAFWAPRACRNLNEGCTVDAECCTGECTLQTGTSTPASTCKPSAGPCRELGDDCTNSSQCCSGVLCVDGTCGGI